MSDDGRRIFKIETVLDLLSGRKSAEASEMLSYLSQRSLDDASEILVAPLAKAWLFSLNPDFMKVCCCPSGGHNADCASTKAKFADNISVEVIPAIYMDSFNVLLDNFEKANEDAEAELVAAAAANKKVKELEPFKKKAEDLEKKLAQAEDKVKALGADNTALKADVAKFAGKVAINEAELENSVKDIVTRAVKASLGSLAVAGAGAVAAGAAGAEAVADAPVEAASNEVPDSFGFGASGANDDGFGF